MPGGAKTFKTAINEMTHWTEFKLPNLLYTENLNLTHKDLSPSNVVPENRLSINLVLNNTVTARLKPLNNGHLSFCAWSWRMFDESHR
jgi:hypothetical protein